MTGSLLSNGLIQSQEEMRRVAGPLMVLLENSGMPIVVSDPRLPDNPVIFASLAFEQLTGYLCDEVIGRNCRFLQTEATDRAAVAEIGAALAAGRGIEKVLRNGRRDGTLFWNKLTITPLRVASGKPAFFIGTLVQVAYGAGRFDERIQPPSIDGGLGGAWYWDVRSGVLKADGYFAALHGLDPETLASGMPVASFFTAIHAEDRMRIRMGVTAMLNGATVFSKDFRLTSSSGMLRWVHAEGRMHLDDDDQPLGFVGRLIDVTDQKRIEERLRIAQTAGGIGTFEYIEGFATVAVSPQFCALLGLRQADTLPISTIASVLQAEADNLIETEGGVAGRISHAEFQIRRADTGEARWIARRSEAIRDLDTTHLRQIGVIYDVTILKQRESQLRNLNEQLEQRVEERTRDRDRFWQNSRDMLAIMSTGGIIHAVNPAWTTILGLQPEEVIGRSFFDFAPPGRAICLSGNIPGVSVAQQSFESCTPDKDGRARWISWLTSQENDLIYAYGRHFTDEKAKEEALQLERARLRAIFDTTSLLIGFTERDGKVVVLNRAFLETMAVDEANVVGVPFWALPIFAGTQGMPETICADMAKAAQGETIVKEIGIKLPNGNERTYELALRPVLDHAGRVIQIVPEAFDTTILRQTEELLRQSQKMEAIGQLTGGIAHDFNNMLTGITGSLDLIQRRIGSGRTADVDRFIDAAMASAQRAAALTHRLLAFARRQSLDARPTNVNALVVGMADLLHRALGEQIELHPVLAEDLWLAMTDANQLESALLNLAINARDAMSEGGRLTIETATLQLGANHPLVREIVLPGDYVTIGVSDTGSGMPPDVLAKVFDPFFTTKPLGQGTGLGLSMVYGFAKQSGGHVDISSVVGRGTTVKLFLPRAVAAEASPADLDRPSQVSPRGRGETVLVVEDDPTVRLLIVTVLAELGYRHLEAIDGRSAIPILQSGARIDLIVSDVGLPGMNGRQLAEIARSLRPGLKVLFVTGYAENAAIRRGFLEPGMEMIVKPFALETLGSKIREMIEE